jgi:hypothetical protein
MVMSGKRAVRPPDFSEEQKRYLAQLLRPYCCHTTGQHDPRHFADDPSASCELQITSAWERAVEELGLSELIGRAVSSPSCGWCGDARRRAKEERELNGLPPLESVLQSFARLSNRRRVRAPKKVRSARARHCGRRIYVEYVWLQSVQDVGACSRIHLKPPQYDPTADIPEDGMPTEYDGFTDADREEFRRVLRDAGATILEVWGGGKWMSVAIANITVRAETVEA